MNLRLSCGKRPPREYPIDDAPAIKQRLWRCCSHTLIREFVSKLRTADVGRGSRPGNVQVKIACQNDRNCRFVLASIVQAIKQLGAAQTVISAALQVKVVADQRSPSNVYFGHQGHPSADPLLERLHIRKVPAWPPEIRLPVKPQDTRIRQRPGGERCLPVVGRRGTRALGQFLELAPKDVVHLQLLSNFPRDIETMCPPGVDVDLLQNYEVGLRVSEKFNDAAQLQTAIDVPVHNTN